MTCKWLITMVSCCRLSRVSLVMHGLLLPFANYLLSGVILHVVFQIPCEDRCLDPQSPSDKALRGSKRLLTRCSLDGVVGS